MSIAGLPKLNDANNAGTKHSEDCTLILTEGDSAMSLAVAGLAVIGRDSYGVFPLRYPSYIDWSTPALELTEHSTTSRAVLATLHACTQL